MQPRMPGHGYRPHASGPYDVSRYGFSSHAYGSHLYPVRAPAGDGEHYCKHTGIAVDQHTGQPAGLPFHQYGVNVDSRTACVRGAPEIRNPVVPPPPPPRVVGPEGIIRELFDFLDMNGDGVLQPRELAGLGDVLSSHWTQAKNSTLLRMINSNPDEIYYGAIPPEAFEKFMLESLFSTFDKLDKNGNGVLDDEELDAVAGAFGQSAADTLFDMGGGVASLGQFIEFVVSQCLLGLQSGEVVAGLGQVLVLGGDDI